MANKLAVRQLNLIENFAERFCQRADLNFAEEWNARADILIECNVLQSHWMFDRRMGNQREPVVVRRTFGWVILGRLEQTGKLKTSVNYARLSQEAIGSLSKGHVIVSFGKGLTAERIWREKIDGI